MTSAARGSRGREASRARCGGRLRLGCRSFVAGEQVGDARIDVFDDHVLSAERLEELLGRRQNVVGDLQHDRGAVGAERLAELLELVVLETRVAELRGECPDAAAGDYAERAADDAERASDQRTAARTPVLRLDELRLAVGLDVENGDVPHLVGK